MRTDSNRRLSTRCHQGLIATLGVAVLLTAGSALAQDPAARSRVRIKTAMPHALAHQLEAEGFDVMCGGVGRTSVDVIVSAQGQRTLEARGLVLELIDVSRPTPSSPS